MNNLMENLNKEQLEAVMHKDGPLLIVAGAGTGKTTVITQKIAYMIEQGWAKPEEILALTFTEKAAGEMAERVDRLLPIGYLDLWISTFHSFAERILKAHGLDIGIPSDFKLLNEFEQWILVKKNLDKFNLDYYRPAGNPTKFIEAMLKHFSRLKDEDITPEDYLKYAGELKQNQDAMLSGAEIAEQEAMRINELANAYHVYEQLLLDTNAMDFGGLIDYSLKLFKKRPAILEKYRRQFKFILVDEFQDTNWAQYELVKMLANDKNNLTVVGDDDQSIYRFRGASMSNILQFKKDYPAAQVALVKNYRNKQNILDLSYEFIKQNNPNRLEWQLNSKKLKVKSKKLNKKLVAEGKGEGVIEVIEGEDLHDEVKKVVEKIAELKIKDKNANWNDFVILVRANDAAKDFCSTLDAAGLPYQFLASRGLYAKPVIIDIISYLKLLDDYHESRAMYRVLNLPIFDFSHHELANFNYWANRKGWSLFEVFKNAGLFNFGALAHNKINKVLSLVAKHTAMAREKAVSEVILAFLNDSGYLKYLTTQDERKTTEIIGYLNQFMKRVKVFETGSDDKSVKAFLEELNMEIDSGEEGSLPFDAEAGPEAIKIMTAHGAKGLEFKYVFIANLVDKRFPTIERKEQIEVPDALVKEILPEGDAHLEEERRLFYVAATRARDGLFFSWAPDYGGARKKKPSRFLVETKLVAANENVKKNGQQIFNSQFPISKQFPITQFSNINPKSKIQNPKFSIPSYFSYTQLAAFSNCPYQYYFAHVVRVPVRGKAIFSFGKTMHSTLQKLFELVKERRGVEQRDLFGGHSSGPTATKAVGPLNFDEILKLYEQNWIDDWYDSKQQKEEYKKKGKNILKDFYEKYKDNWPAVKFTEQAFNMKIKNDKEIYTIRGVIDRVDDAHGKVKIIDYKTGQPKNKLSFEEKEQLLIYQLAARDLFKGEVGSLAFYYLDNNSEMEFLGTNEELLKVKEKIIGTVGEIKRGEFPPRPSQLCKFCDFFSICEFRQN